MAGRCRPFARTETDGDEGLTVMDHVEEFVDERHKSWCVHCGSGRIPPVDIVTACRDHLVVLLEIAFDAYAQLGVHIDPQQHYTKEYFASLKRTIDDAEVELWGWIRESLVNDGFDEDDRWHELRSHVGGRHS